MIVIQLFQHTMLMRHGAFAQTSYEFRAFGSDFYQCLAPIGARCPQRDQALRMQPWQVFAERGLLGDRPQGQFAHGFPIAFDQARSEERSVGIECGITFRSRWSSYNSNKKKQLTT